MAISSPNPLVEAAVESIEVESFAEKIPIDKHSVDCAVSTFTLCSVGDTFTSDVQCSFKNVAGTVTQLGTATSISALKSDTSLASSGVACSASGTNAIATVTGTVTGGLTPGTLACTVEMLGAAN